MKRELRAENICVFDTETSGTNVEEDRIIQAFVGLMDADGNWRQKYEWVIDWDMDIPQGASDVHGYTRERLEIEGRKDGERCISEIVNAIMALTPRGIPLVAYNLSFDASLLRAEVERSGSTLGSEAWIADACVDPFVIDKYRFKYRKGKRNLGTIAPIYGVQPDESKLHDAAEDCRVTGLVALKQLSGYKGSWDDLHVLQIREAAEQRASLEKYFLESGKRNDDGSEISIDKGWPFYSSRKLAQSA